MLPKSHENGTDEQIYVISITNIKTLFSPTYGRSAFIFIFDCFMLILKETRNHWIGNDTFILF